MPNAVIDGYEAAAAELIPRFEAIPTDVLLKPVSHLLPTIPCRVLDVGAGTGRNPAWFASNGHRVTASEPVRAFRKAAAASYPDTGIRWLDDTLPQLQTTRDLGEAFDFVLLSAVWQHVETLDRAAAMGSLAGLMAPGAMLIMSVRHGPGAPDRPVYASSDTETQDLASQYGLALTFIRRTESIQAANRAAGVAWSWMAFKAT